MNYTDEMLREALNESPPPPPRAEFWDRLHERFESAEIGPRQTPGTGVEVAVVCANDQPRVRKWPIAVAAATIAIVGIGAVILRDVARDTDQPSSATTLQPDLRASGRIDDAEGIDLQAWLLGAPTWPTQIRESYVVFDTTQLPSGWTVLSERGSNDIPSPRGGANWGWTATVQDDEGSEIQIRLVQRGGDTPVQTDGTTVEVRGHTSSWSAGLLEWKESDGAFASLQAPDDMTIADLVTFADALTTTRLDVLPSDDTFYDEPFNLPTNTPHLAGTIGDRRWYVNADGFDIELVVEGANGSGVNLASAPTSVPPTITVSTSGVPGGVVVFGITPLDAVSARVELSDGTSIELPMATVPELGSLFGVPIPAGLDVTDIVFLDADQQNLHRLFLPPFTDPTGGGSTGTSPFGIPGGSYATGSKTR